MSGSRTDRIYRSILLNKFFTKGWGKPENLRRLFQFRRIISNRETCMKLVDKDHPVMITKEEHHRDHTLIEGRFESPFLRHCPGLLPPEAELAHFQALLPARWRSHLRPTVLHLAGTGDHYYWKRRTLLARPLLKENGIASIILENPFYGLRKPPDQVRSSLRNVSDLFVMGGCLILESMVLFHWAQRRGLGPLGITGISMGGHMASLAASVWAAPIALVPCLSWTSASAAFTSGVLSHAINWALLEQQYVSDNIYRNELKKMVKILNVPELDRAASPADGAPSGGEGAHFHAGRRFARGYPQEVAQMQRLAVQEEGSASSTPAASLARLALEVIPSLTAAANPLTSIARSKAQLLRPAAGKSPTPARPATMVEAFNFMHGIMDECTHLANFPVPVDPTLALIVQARDDAYVPRDGLTSLTELWPGSTVRFLDTGHVTAYLFNQDAFRVAIADAFNKMIHKYNL